MTTPEEKPKPPLWIRVSLFIIAILILGAVYLFQQTNFFRFLAFLVPIGDDPSHPYTVFIVNKTFRLILNDFACLILIYVFFFEKKYLKIAFYLFLVEIIVLLPLYFTVKLFTEGDSEISSPLLSQIHRLIVNPTLMILLMAGFLYQNFQQKHRL